MRTNDSKAAREEVFSAAHPTRSKFKFYSKKGSGAYMRRKYSDIAKEDTSASESSLFGDLAVMGL